MVSSSLLIHGPLVCLVHFFGFVSEPAASLQPVFTLSSSLSSTSAFS